MKRSHLGGPLLLAFVLVAVVGADRALLWHFGLPPWQADRALHFRLRPHAPALWVRDGSERVNAYGYFDDEFPQAKPAGEVRAFFAGDSIVLGSALSMRDILPNRLEALLRERAGPGRSYQVIDGGVQGYWTEQYPEALRRGLAFEPDLLLLGFCMNDVMGHYALDRAHGGPGLDYHGIVQISQAALSYLVNETGFGRFAVALRQTRAQREFLLRRQTYGVHRIAEPTDDPEVAEAWARVWRDLKAAYGIAAAHRLPIALVVFPYAFQLGHPEWQEPQRRLAAHAARHGVPVLDAAGPLEVELARGATPDDLFLDEDHFSARGNAVVAAALLDFLQAHTLLPAPTAGAAAPAQSNAGNRAASRSYSASVL